MRARILLILWFLSCGVSTGYAQNAQQERRVAEEKRTSLDRLAAKYQTAVQRWVLEYGGWMNFRYTDFHNDDNNADVEDSLKASFDTDVRIWLKATLKPPVGADYDNEQVFYFRIKDLYTQEYGDSSLENFDNNGPHLDYAYGVLDFSPWWIEVGRKYFSIGRGIAYSDVNDGIQINYKVPGWNVGAFASHSLPHEENIDTSVPGYDKNSDRYFFGIGAGYSGIKGHQVYGFTMAQRDFSNERPNDPNQQYTYNSNYFGIGARGKSFWKTTYFSEVIRETGKSYIAGSNLKANIDAWAADAGLEKQLDIFLTPQLSLEYAYGSGDADRADVTNTISGNASGGDNNFLYFGYKPTGLALAPRLSNLHMARLGTKLQPLERMTVQLNYYRFWKDKKEGAIFDAEATQSSLDVGQEIDLEASWQMLSDLDMTLEYGHFVPGDAYAVTANDNTDYFSVSVTHTF